MGRRFPERPGRPPLIQKILEKRPQLVSELLSPHRQGQVRAEVAGHGARVVIVALELQGDDRVRSQSALDRIRELYLLASPRLATIELGQNRGGEDVAADDREVGWLGPRLWLFDHVRDRVQRAPAAVRRDHTVAADLASWKPADSEHGTSGLSVRIDEL